MLGDLARRRRALQAQLEQLRAGRDRVLETFAVARRQIEELSARFESDMPGAARSTAAGGGQAVPGTQEIDGAAAPGRAGVAGDEAAGGSGAPGGGARSDDGGARSGGAAGSAGTAARPVRTSGLVLGEVPGGPSGGAPDSPAGGAPGSEAGVVAAAAAAGSAAGDRSAPVGTTADAEGGPAAPVPVVNPVGLRPHIAAPKAAEVAGPAQAVAAGADTSTGQATPPGPVAATAPRVEERRSSALRILRRRQAASGTTDRVPVGRESVGEGVRIIRPDPPEPPDPSEASVASGPDATSLVSEPSPPPEAPAPGAGGEMVSNHVAAAVDSDDPAGSRGATDSAGEPAPGETTTGAGGADASEPDDAVASPDGSASAAAGNADARVAVDAPGAGADADVPHAGGEADAAHAGGEADAAHAGAVAGAPHPGTEPDAPRAGAERDPASAGLAREGAHADTAPARVEDLFARIRADREAAVAAAREVLARAEEAMGSDAASPPTPGQGTADPGLAEPVDQAGEPAAVADADEHLLQQRDAVVDPLVAQLARRLKRALQDEQNAALDRLRTARGRPGADTLLGAADAQTTPYRHVATRFLEEAARAASSRSEFGTVAVAVDDLAGHLAGELASTVRSRVERVLDEAAADDLDLATTSERIGAVYREWKTQRVERLASYWTVAAYSRGTFVATPEGTPLRWIVDDDAPCPDCDDNALAGATPRGRAFPTGQHHPPAHAGCRCLVTPVAP